MPSSPSWAGRSLRFEWVSTRDGLSQRSVHAVVQDPQGFLWIGTQDGLNRWDGHTFLVYNHQPDNEASLSHNDVRALWVDRSGELWVGTDGGGLDHFDPVSERFRHYRHDPGDPDSLADNHVRALLEDRRGTLWVATAGGLDALDLLTGRMRHYRHDAGDPTSLAGDDVRALHESTSGDLWIGTTRGLHRLGRDGGFQRHRHRPEDPASLSHDRVQAIAEDRDGNLWIGTPAGLDRFDPATGTVTRRTDALKAVTELGDEGVRALLTDSDGRLWLGTQRGLGLFEPRNGRYSHFCHRHSDPDSLVNDEVSSLYQDRSEVLWIGTLAGGLSKWDPRGWHLPLYRHDPETPESLGGNVVVAFAAAGGGDLWIGTLDAGLDLWDRKNEVFHHYRHDPDDPASLAEDRVTCLLRDRSGELWVGTGTGGLHRLDEESGGFRRYTHDPLDPASLASDAIVALFEDAAGAFWIGTADGGLDRLDRSTGVFTHFRHDPDDPGSLGSDRITAFAEGPDGRFWVGTRGGGLQLFDRQAGTFTRFAPERGNPKSLPGTVVQALYVDQTATLWIGTLGGGLARLADLDPQTGRASFDRWAEQEGLADSVIYGIQPDSTGGLWLSTNHGLARFDPVSGTSRSWRERHGLQGDEFSFGGHFRGANGEIFFGGYRGFNAFFPERVEINPYPPPVVLTRLLRFSGSKPEEVPTRDLRSIDVTYEDHIFSLEFAALDFVAPHENRYASRLKDSAGGWVDLGTERQVTYTDLPSGRYSIQVRAANADGIWNEEGLTLELRVWPPPWLSLEAWICYVLIGMSLTAVLVRALRRRRRLQARYQLQLEYEVEMRTRQLEERNVELEELNRRLAEASVTDALTGLRNRRFVLEEGLLADIALAQRGQRRDAQSDGDEEAANAPFDLLLLMIDLDHFKEINDLLGHSAGDMVLGAFGDILRTECRGSDIIVRWGGDEFLVVGRRANRSQGHVLAERIRQAAREKLFEVGSGRRVSSTCSIGFAYFPFVEADPELLTCEQVVAIADRALTLAKSSGKDTTVGIFSTLRTTGYQLADRILHDPEHLAGRGEIEIRVFASRSGAKTGEAVSESSRVLSGLESDRDSSRTRSC